MQGNLFQMPNPPERPGRGRPKIDINKEKQRLIRCALRGGMSADAVGRSVGIDPKTVRKYFCASEPVTVSHLQQAADRARVIASALEQIADDLAFLAGKKGDSE